VVVLGDGKIVADGPVREIMSTLPLFASQISKLFHSPQFLTVEDVMAALSQAEAVL
jgi:energy-coupling factor transport system ATP-binding protein